MSDRWLKFKEAAETIRAQIGGSIGRSEALVKTARASGEVRTRARDPVLLTKDDGILGFNMKPGSMTADGEKFSSDDLLDWLSRQHVKAAAPLEPKPRAQNKRSRVATAIDELWPNSPPDQSVLANSLLCKKVGDWLKADCQKQNVPVDIPSNDTILRAAGRK